MMDAKEFLNRAYRMEQRVQSKLEQIEALKSLATHVTASFGAEPVDRTRNNTAMQDTVIRIMEAEQELNREIDELVDTKQEIKRTIDLVPDVTLRLILEKRNLCFEKWEQIAIDTYYSLRSVQEKHREAVRIVQGILDQRGD
jgi:seryl-tRNA synthetase